MHAIETRGLTKYYGKVHGIIDMDLQIPKGEIVGFIGPNGAGKTTTIRLLLSLLFPTRGTGSIFGKDIVKDGPDIKKIVGFVPSEVNYYQKMTAGELLEYSARFYGVALNAHFNEMVEILNLDLTKKLEDMSMGNKKKVISRVTFHTKQNAKDITLELPGIISPEKNGDEFTLLYKGEIPPLLKYLSQLPIEKIVIHEPDLEEVFMHYYANNSIKL